MAFLLPHTFVFSFLLQSFWAMMLMTKAVKEEGWTLKYAFNVFVVKLFGFCLSIGYIARVILRLSLSVKLTSGLVNTGQNSKPPMHLLRDCQESEKDDRVMLKFQRP